MKNFHLKTDNKYLDKYNVRLLNQTNAQCHSMCNNNGQNMKVGFIKLLIENKQYFKFDSLAEQVNKQKIPRLNSAFNYSMGINFNCCVFLASLSSKYIE